MLELIQGSPQIEITSAIRYDPKLADLVLNCDVEHNYPSHFYLLDYHRKRLLEAAKYFSDIFEHYKTETRYLENHQAFKSLLYNGVAEHAQTLETAGNVDTCGSSAVNRTAVKGLDDSKVRLGLLANPSKSTFEIRWQIQPVSTLPLCSLFPEAFDENISESSHLFIEWSLYLDTAPTPPDPFTTFKTGERGVYNAAYDRATGQVENITNEDNDVIMYDVQENITEGTRTSVYFRRNDRWITPRVTSLDVDGKAKKLVGGQRGSTRRWALDRALCIEGDVPLSTVRDGECIWVSNGVRGFGFGFLKRPPATKG